MTDLFNHPKMLLDPYGSWAKKEGVPVTEDFGVDLLTCPTSLWPRFGVDGGIVNLIGRGNFISMFVLNIPPAGKTTQQQHLAEEVIYVLSGYGSTTVEASDGHRHSFEWGPKSLFAMPLNAKHQHFNSSGREHARLVSTNNVCMMLNAFHNEKFVFGSVAQFPEREGTISVLRGEGEMISIRPGKNMWETNFVPDLGVFDKLTVWEARGAGGSCMYFVLADGTMHAHVSEMPVGTYKKAHKHGPDFHVFAVSGHGFSLFWYDISKDLVRVDWKHGVVFAPDDQMWHQHFNTSSTPSRYLAISYGSLRYPFTIEMRKVFLGVDVTAKEGGCQIEYADQDPRIHQIYLDELAKHGTRSKMSKFIDESKYEIAS